MAKAVGVQVSPRPPTARAAIPALGISGRSEATALSPQRTPRTRRDDACAPRAHSGSCSPARFRSSAVGCVVLDVLRRRVLGRTTPVYTRTRQVQATSSPVGQEFISCPPALTPENARGDTRALSGAGIHRFRARATVEPGTTWAQPVASPKKEIGLRWEAEGRLPHADSPVGQEFISCPPACRPSASGAAGAGAAWVSWTQSGLSLRLAASSSLAASSPSCG